MHIMCLKYIESFKKTYFKIKLQKVKHANSAEPDQTPRCAASNLVRHCLPMFHKRTQLGFK